MNIYMLEKVLLPKGGGIFLNFCCILRWKQYYEYTNVLRDPPYTMYGQQVKVLGNNTLSGFFLYDENQIMRRFVCVAETFFYPMSSLVL